jgi:Fe-S cluster assembly ATP-binding protein
VVKFNRFNHAKDGSSVKGVRLYIPSLDLMVNVGEVRAIMEPTGSGKSLLEMDPDERAREGVFMAFQYPVEIPGVNMRTS